MPLIAQQHVRKMRGGAQAHLLRASDGQFYIVKFQNNPQHPRILVNELIASVLLKYLQIPTPETALIEVNQEFLRRNPEVFIQLGTQKMPINTGWHFGSRYPGDPTRLAVYDFVPDALLIQVNNVSDFLGVLVFDKWTANSDGRQCVFFRARLRDWSAAGPAHPLKMGFLAVMIDEGFIFDGPNWTFRDSPVQGLYTRKLVYEQVRSLESFQPWLDQVMNFPEEVIDQAYKKIPLEWICGQEDTLQELLGQLIRRRKRVPDLISDCRRANKNPFPNWL